MRIDELRKLKADMVGGGAGTGIVKAHLAAMRLDGSYELVARP